MLTLNSSIPPRLKQKVLFKGSILAFFGLLLLLTTAIYSSFSFLEQWGVLIFVLGMGLVALGLIPYRRLCFLETHPHQIVIEPSMWTVTAAQQTLRFSPKAIQAIHYIEKKGLHGVKIEFYSSHSPIFLPFFSRITYESHLKSYCNHRPKSE